MEQRETLGRPAVRADLPGLVRWTLELVDRLRPPGAPAGRVAFQLRFLVGACLLGSLVALAALALTLAQGDRVNTRLLCAFLACLLLQLAAIRLGAPPRLLVWTVPGTVALYLSATSLIQREFDPAQLPWLALIPLTALVLGGPRADQAEARPSAWSLLGGMAVALAVAALIIVAHDAGFTLGQPLAVEPPWVHVVTFALFLLSTGGLLFLYDLSARETESELQRIRRLLSVCAWCRKIQDQGEWVPLERYVARRHQASLSHGICPACFKAQYPTAG